ncbi:hypothetical protein BC830DRAFT_1095099 [Chytriomyces sp. MP71]|nr:hypothetical protein BC830DRAFT_1095099 [Chytriomyces sp. MP71]
MDEDGKQAGIPSSPMLRSPTPLQWSNLSQKRLSNSTGSLLPSPSYSGNHHDSSTVSTAGINSPSVSNKMDLMSLETAPSVVPRMRARKAANPRPTSTIEYGSGGSSAYGGIYVGPDESTSASELRNAWMIGLQPPVPDPAPPPFNASSATPTPSGQRQDSVKGRKHTTYSTDALPTASTATTATATSSSCSAAASWRISNLVGSLHKHAPTVSSANSSTITNTGTSTPGTAAATLRKNESAADSNFSLASSTGTNGGSRPDLRGSDDGGSASSGTRDSSHQHPFTQQQSSPSPWCTISKVLKGKRLRAQTNPSSVGDTTASVLAPSTPPVSVASSLSGTACAHTTGSRPVSMFLANALCGAAGSGCGGGDASVEAQQQLFKARAEVADLQARALKQEGTILSLTQEVKEEKALREELQMEVKELRVKLMAAASMEKHGEGVKRSLQVEEKKT